MKRTWWHDKVAYQIYPKSFYDTNDDGIGDIRGIIEKLDYLKMLGIDIIWVSPIYQSPFVDQGYDISDYYAIDPAFGTMNDFEELLEDGSGRKSLFRSTRVVPKGIKRPGRRIRTVFLSSEGKRRTSSFR